MGILAHPLRCSALPDAAMALQMIEQGDLAGVDLPACRWQIEPAGAIDLGKFGDPARARRPFEREGVAPDRGGVALARDRPGMDDLAAGLPDRRHSHEFAIG